MSSSYVSPQERFPEDLDKPCLSIPSRSARRKEKKRLKREQYAKHEQYVKDVLVLGGFEIPGTGWFECERGQFQDIIYVNKFLNLELKPSDRHPPDYTCMCFADTLKSFSDPDRKPITFRGS